MRNFAKLVATVVQQANGSEEAIRQGLIAAAGDASLGISSAERNVMVSTMHGAFDWTRFISAMRIELSFQDDALLGIHWRDWVS